MIKYYPGEYYVLKGHVIYYSFDKMVPPGLKLFEYLDNPTRFSIYGIQELREFEKQGLIREITKLERYLYGLT